MLEFKALSRAWAENRKDEWILAAQQATWIMNATPWLKRPVNIKRLLGSSFFEDEGSKSKSEWEAEKADLKKRARWLASAARDVKAGRKKARAAFKFPGIASPVRSRGE